MLHDLERESNLDASTSPLKRVGHEHRAAAEPHLEATKHRHQRRVWTRDDHGEGTVLAGATVLLCHIQSAAGTDRRDVRRPGRLLLFAIRPGCASEGQSNSRRRPTIRE